MIHLRTNTHTEIWKADCKNLVWGDKGEVGLPDLTVVLYVPVTAAFISYLIQLELQQQNLPNSLCQTKCACQPDLKLGDRSRGRLTILVMCWVLLQAVGQGWGRNWKWICQAGIKVQLENLPVPFSLPLIDQREFRIMWLKDLRVCVVQRFMRD